MNIKKVETEGLRDRTTRWEIDLGFLIPVILLGFTISFFLLVCALGEYLVPGFWG